MSDKYGPLIRIAKTEFINKITDGTFEEKCLIIIIEQLEKIQETLNAIWHCISLSIIVNPILISLELS